MAITKNVTITTVVEKGGEHPHYTVHYIQDDGSKWKVGNLASKLDEVTRKEIKKVKEEIDEGGMPKRSIAVEQTVTDKGKFWNLTKLGAVVSKTSSNTHNKLGGHIPKPGSLTDIEKSQGAQRGNVLSNAVALVVAAGVTDLDKSLQLVKSTATKLLVISNDLENPEEVELTLEEDDTITEELGF